MIKALQKVGITYYPYMTNTTNLILNGEKLKAFYLR